MQLRPARPSLTIVDVLLKSQALSHNVENHCFVECDTRLRRFISGTKKCLFIILPCATGLRRVRSNFSIADKPWCTEGGEARYGEPNRQCTDKTIGLLYFSYKTAMSREKIKAHAHIVWRPFSTLCPSAFSAFFQPNGSSPLSTVYLLHQWAPPTSTRTAPPSTLEDKRWRLNAFVNHRALDGTISRRYIGFARSNCRDAQGIFGGLASTSSNTSKFRVKHVWNERTWQRNSNGMDLSTGESTQR